ncbi:MAG: hypothetical protein ACRES9_00995 [Gammaproteobacteria bacterium]
MHISRKTGLMGSLTAIAAAGLLLAGCSSGGSNMNDNMNGSSMNNSQHMTSMSTQSTPMNEFGGPMYTGKPDLGLTAALLQAGGGASNFSLVTALNSMLGKDTVNSEVKKLTQQYGAQRVQAWVKGIDFAVADTVKIATAKGVKLPPPANLSGKDLAVALVKAGTDKDGYFWAGLLFDHILSHPIHEQVMADTDSQYSKAYDGNYHQITNQAFYDVAQALGHTNIKLSPYH